MTARVKVMTTSVLSLARLACVAEGYMYLLTDVGSRLLAKSMQDQRIPAGA
jgi:hypothetical protein